jgi:hypothetical protein
MATATGTTTTPVLRDTAASTGLPGPDGAVGYQFRR